MSAPEPIESETRVIIDADSERLVLMAHEMYAFAGADLEKAVRAYVAGFWGKEAATVQFEKFEVAPPLAAVAVVPARADGKQEANLVLGMYVGNADGTVQFLAFYVNPAGATDAAGPIDLARKIAATLKTGSAKLMWNSGLRSFPGVHDDRLVLTAPEGFAASVQEGPDFSVYRIHKLLPLGQPTSNCGIYLGGHPAFHYVQTKDRPDKITPLKGKLFGQKIEWKTWSKANGITTEVIVPHPKDRQMSVHVFCSAANEDELNALRTMAETIRVEEDKK
jgi:hypothetical protein